jgi:protein ImuB
MVVCLLIPRLALLAALGDRRALLGEPVALAPEAGREQRVGEASAAAEAFGIARGMAMGEALTRCPGLRLVPPDPERERALWSEALDRLEGIGASVESDQPGAAYFAAGGLRTVHGGRLEGVLAALRRSFRRPDDGSSSTVLPSTRIPRSRQDSGGVPRDRRQRPASLLAASLRVGAGPSRFVAYVAATRARAGRRGRRPDGATLGATAVERQSETVVPPRSTRAFLAPLPVSLLRSRPELDWLPGVLERLGIRTLGELAELSAPAVAERFGHPGLLALDLARGRDTPLVPRRPPEPVTERVTLPESASGPQLEHALELLIARLLARRERRGRSLRSLAVSARFVEGGTWRERVTLRRASADPDRLRVAIGIRLSELPAPAEVLGLEVEAFGPPAHDQRRLVEEVDPREARRARLGEAVRQVREAAGSGAALRILEVDPGSRVPERRAALSPYPVDEEGR